MRVPFSRLILQVGQSKLEPFGNLMGAKAGFGSKFFDKTRNNWGNRDKFVKVPGKYMLMDMDYGDDDGAEAEASTSSSSAPIPESKLPLRVQDIVKLVSDTKMMTKAMAELEVDVKKMPIGKISKQQVECAFSLPRVCGPQPLGGAGGYSRNCEACMAISTEDTSTVPQAPYEP